MVGVELGVYLLGEATPELNPELNAEAWLVGVPAGDPPGLVEIRFPLILLQIIMSGLYEELFLVCVSRLTILE